MSITSSLVILDLSAEVTFNILDYMRLKQEKNTAPFHNMSEWENAVLIASKSAMKSLLIAASHVAGFQSVAPTQSKALSAHQPPIGVFRPLFGGLSIPSYDGRANTVTLPELSRKAGNYLKGQTVFSSPYTLATGFFVGIFGPTLLRQLKEVAIDYKCDLLLLLAIWCELTEPGDSRRDLYKVALETSGAMDDRVMRQYCYPHAYSAAQLAVMLMLRDSMINNMLLAMSKNLPPWYRLTIVQKWNVPKMSGPYPAPKFRNSDLVRVEHITELLNVPQGKIAWPADYALVRGMKCLAMTASRALTWTEGSKCSPSHVNVDPPKHNIGGDNASPPSPDNEDDSDGKHKKRKHVHPSGIRSLLLRRTMSPQPKNLLGAVRGIASSKVNESNMIRSRGLFGVPGPWTFNGLAHRVAEMVIGVHLEEQEVLEILLEWEDNPPLRKYVETMDPSCHGKAFTNLWSALGHHPNLLGDDGGVVVVATCVLGWGSAAKWIAQTLATNLHWVSGNNATVLFNSISLRVDGTFWSPSRLMNHASMDPRVLGTDLFVNYEARLSDQDITMLCRYGVVGQMPSSYNNFDLTKTKNLPCRSFAYERVCSLGSIVVVRSDDKYFALADWPKLPIPPASTLIRRMTSSQCQAWLVGVGDDLRAALREPAHMIPVVAAFGDPLMQWVAYKMSGQTREVVFMQAGQTFYDCALPDRLLMVSAELCVANVD